VPVVRGSFRMALAGSLRRGPISSSTRKGSRISASVKRGYSRSIALSGAWRTEHYCMLIRIERSRYRGHEPLGDVHVPR
jgi:hypothetical protein